MFPQYAAFICRKCLTPFYFSDQKFMQISEANNIGCPRCHESENHRNWVTTFFTFYPRLIKATELMRAEGVAFSSYEFHTHTVAKMFWITKLWFKCTRCGQDLGITSLKESAKKPPALVCHACSHRRVKKKTVKEFLVSLSNVNLSAWHMMSHQWNLFSPLRLNPDDYPIQWQRYKKDTHK